MIDLSKKREELDKKASLGLPKILSPGVHVCTINSINLRDGYKPNSLYVQLNLEGPDLTESGFVGFIKDKDNLNSGTYNGQIGRVNLSRWAFESKVIRNSKGEFSIDRDTSIISELYKLATECSDESNDKVEKLMEGNVDTIEEFVSKASNILSGSRLRFVIGGKEYKNQKGYTQYNLFLPKVDKLKTVFEKENTTSSNLATFDPETMIEEDNKAKEVESFEETADFDFLN